MRIGIDLDEVVADTMPAVIHFHNRKYGTDFKKGDFYSYHFWDVWGGTKDEAIKKMYDFFATDHFAKINPVAGSLVAINTLKENGHELFVITGRQNEIIEETEKWIKKHFPEIFSGIHFANSYGLTGHPIKKSAICAQLGIKIMIDDDMDHAKDLTKFGIKVLLFDQPWNQDNLEGDIERVFSWKEIINKISGNFN